MLAALGEGGGFSVAEDRRGVAHVPSTPAMTTGMMLRMTNSGLKTPMEATPTLQRGARQSVRQAGATRGEGAELEGRESGDRRTPLWRYHRRRRGLRR